MTLCRGTTDTMQRTTQRHNWHYVEADGIIEEEAAEMEYGPKEIRRGPWTGRGTPPIIPIEAIAAWSPPVS